MVVIWRVVAKDVSRAVVDLLFDLLQSIRSNPGKVRSFRKILPHQPVVILHATFLPRTVGFAEVTLTSQQVIHKTMFRELKPVIVGDGFDFKVSQDQNHRNRNVSALFGKRATEPLYPDRVEMS